MPLSVNGEIVEDEVIRQESAAMRPRYEELMGAMDPIEREMQLREWSKENVIERVLLRQEAWKDPEAIQPELLVETTDEADETVRRETETRLRIERMIHKIAARLPQLKAKEVSEFYKKNRDRFATPELFRASHIVKNVDEKTDEETARTAIEEAQKELASGALFEEIADRFSDCGGNGGSLGYFPRGEMVEEFENVIAALKPGELSPIFRTSFGFHIARLDERRPPGYRTLSEVQGEIEAELMRERQERALEEFVDKLKAQADIRKAPRTAS